MTQRVHYGLPVTDLSQSEPEFALVDRIPANPPMVIRSANGQLVAADHTGKPYRLETTGQAQVYQNPSEMSPEWRISTWRGSDPHVTHTQAPTAAETESIKAQLRAKGYDRV